LCSPIRAMKIIIISWKCCVFFFPAEGEGFVKRYDIFRRGTAGEKGVKAVRKINPYRLPPLVQTGGGNTITHIALCTGGGQQSFCIYYYYYQFSGRTNIIKWSLSLCLTLTLTPCPSLLRCARVHIIMRGPYYIRTPPLQSTNWPYPVAWGTKKKKNIILLGTTTTTK